MIEALLPAIILGKIRHYKLHYLFLTWSFYPILITQIIGILAQVGVFLNNYYLVQFSSELKTSMILSFIFAMFIFRLYKPALTGSGSIIFGTLLNDFVIAQNNGKMPVFPSFSYVTGYVKPNSFQMVQGIHVLGSAATHWKFLTDYIDVGYSILSPGDVFIHFFTFLMFYYTIKAVNLRFNPKYLNVLN
jgi:hypothetical protein